jgi:hypothetical protein
MLDHIVAGSADCSADHRPAFPVTLLSVSLIAPSAGGNHGFIQVS